MSDHGRYRVLQKIADGGMAEIFLGSQRGAVGFERLVVLKRVRPDFAADQQFRDALIDEAHIAMTLHHSNIAQVLDLGVAAGHTFLVLEFVDGWDLDRLLKRADKAKLPLPAELALYVVTETCRALGYAHSRARAGKALGIIHRDVTPHNILISEQGEVKLTDFGIATARTKRADAEVGAVKGKMGFMSPEQAAGLPLDARCDLYTLGTALYVMATGKRPFIAEGDGPMLALTRKGEYPAPEQVNPGVHPEVARLIKRAMQRDPNERYRSAEEMLHDAEQVQRSALRPAGQTELKRWLSELAVLDGAVPIGRAPRSAAKRSPGEASGSDLVLQVLEPSVSVNVSGLPPPLPPPFSLPPARGRPAAAASSGVSGLEVGLSGKESEPSAGPRQARPERNSAPELPSVGADAEASTGPRHARPERNSAPELASAGADAEPSTGPRQARPERNSAPELASAGAAASAFRAAATSGRAWARPASASMVQTSAAPPPGSGGNVAGQLVLVALAVGLVFGIWFIAGLVSTPGAVVAKLDAGASARALVSTEELRVNEPRDAAGLDLDAREAAALGESPADLAVSTDSADAGVPGTVRLFTARRVAAPAAGDDGITVQLTSIPSGVAVYANGQAYGLTPTSMYCQALLTYDLEFVSDGRPPLTGRIYLPRRNGQVIEATLLAK